VTTFHRSCRSLAIASILASSGSLQLVAPLLAQTAPAPAGQTIQNRATATYQDPSGQNLSTVSNTVTVTVAEVGGITVKGIDIVDVNQGSISTGDSLQYIFDVTNVGNDPTKFFIPGANNIFKQGVNVTKVEVLLDKDGDGVYGEPLVAGEVVEVTDATNGLETEAIPSLKKVQVRVTATVTATTAGTDLIVRLGNTDPPGPQNSQNIADLADGAATLNDVRTVDDSTPIPVNGEREAADTLSQPLGTATLERALAKVLKTRIDPVDQGDPTVVTDDKITYRLDLEVQNTSPTPFLYAPGDLEGTLPQAQVTGVTAPTGGKFILVSDAIPAGTVLDTTAGSISAPNNWTVVYSTTSLATAPTGASWSATVPTTGPITRIGWVYTGGASIAKNYKTASDPTGGFRFRVTTSNLTGPTSIYNLAQVFGETVGDPNNGIIYDESGDNNPNNFDGTTPSTNGLGGYDPNTDKGVADPNQGVDTNNNNTGQGADGEVNVTPIGVTPTGGILNGPDGQPAATGPDGTNQTDFVNQSAPVDTTTQNGFDPDPVTFNNRISNPSSGRLDNVVIKPIPPSVADYAANSTSNDQQDVNTGYGDNGTLPNNTTVTIQIVRNNQAREVVYTYSGGAFNLTSSRTSTDATFANLQPDATPTPIRFSGFDPGTTQAYQVTVNLPSGNVSTAYPVPIVAFVDEDSDNNFDRSASNPNAEPIFNLKIDRVYTGYVKLLKESRILQGTGPAVPSGQDTFSTANKTPAPGNIIEYRITYNNFSTQAPANSGSVSLSANGLVITEDGNAAPNTWATYTAHELGTVANQGTVEYFTASGDTTPIGTTDPASGTTVDKYRNQVGNLFPGNSGAFTFRRKVNETPATP
jgi:ribosomal protein S11